MKRKGLHLNSSLTSNAVITNKSIYGANHIVVEGAGSIIADTVMNGIFYPRDEVEKLAANTNGDIHAPSAHPTDSNGNFISAGDPQAVHQNYVGAISTNYRMKGDRLVRDIAIDPEVANRSADGKEIIRRIEANEDTDTSTGLLLQLEETSGIGNDGEPYEFIARNMELDHDAILLGERGAATTLQGVGMFANSKGDEFAIDQVTINESMIASNLPLAPASHTWNEADALTNIKAFTNSNDNPSSNFRRFFLTFDRKNADDFSAYTNLFADVIDGVPHAVKQPITNAGDNEHAKAYVNRFDNEPTNNKQGFVKKVLNALFGKLMGNELSHNDTHEKIYQKLNEGRPDNNCSYWPMDIFDSHFIYRGDNDKLYKQPYSTVDDEIVFIGEKSEVERIVEFKQITNTLESIMDKAELIALLAANGITANADMSEADLKAALNTALSDKTAKPEVDTVVNTQIADLTKMVNTLTLAVTANADKELDTSVAAVVALNKGIDEATAKTMGLTACNAFLAANGQPAFGVIAGQHKQVNADESCASLKLEA